jgi:hypothetical protein
LGHGLQEVEVVVDRGSGARRHRKEVGN